jgi:ORF6N domain
MAHSHHIRFAQAVFCYLIADAGWVQAHRFGRGSLITEIAQRIRLLRGQRVVMDTDLAAFYGETTKRFNQQVARNAARFPDDFRFQLDSIGRARVCRADRLDAPTASATRAT